MSETKKYDDMIKKAAIHLDRYGEVIPTYLRYKEILEYNGIESSFVDVSDINFWDKVVESDLFIYRFYVCDDHKQIARSILPIIEKYYKKIVFPNEQTAWTYDDKIKQAMLLGTDNHHMVESWCFFDKRKAIEWLKDAEYPLVFKLISGSRSQNVIYIKDFKKARQVVNLMFGKGVITEGIRLPGSTYYKDISVKSYLHEIGCKVKRFINHRDLSAYWSRQKNYCLFQKFLPNNNFDTRITVIGNRVFGFTRDIRSGDFRASGSGKINFDCSNIDERMVEIALKVSNTFRFQTMAYDFIYDERKEPKIVEISYTFSDAAFDKAEGYWDDKMNFKKIKNCAQYYQLCDLLGVEKLKLPQHLQFN